MQEGRPATGPCPSVEAVGVADWRGEWFGKGQNGGTGGSPLSVWSICITRLPKIPEFFMSAPCCLLCCQKWCKLQLSLHPLSLFSTELLSLRGRRELLTILTLGRITGDRASWSQPTLLSLDKGEQHWVWLPSCSHTRAYTPMHVQICMRIYIYTHRHSLCLYQAISHMLPHPTPSSSIDHHFMYHSFHLNPPLPSLNLPWFNNPWPLISPSTLSL